MAGEILAHRLASIHNLRVLVRLVGELRDAIEAGRFHQVSARLREQWLAAPLP